MKWTFTYHVVRDSLRISVDVDADIDALRKSPESTRILKVIDNETGQNILSDLEKDELDSLKHACIDDYNGEDEDEPSNSDEDSDEDEEELN